MGMKELKRNHRRQEYLFSGIFVVAMLAILFYYLLTEKYGLGMAALVVGVILIGTFFILLVRKLDTRTTCKNCGFDLSNVIYLIKDQDSLFCPKCGHKHV